MFEGTGEPLRCFETKLVEKTTGCCKQYRQCMSIDAVMASQAERPMQRACVHTPPGGLRTAQAATAAEEALNFCLLPYQFTHPGVTSVDAQSTTTLYAYVCGMYFNSVPPFMLVAATAIYVPSIRVYICGTDFANTQIQNSLHLPLFRCFICFPYGCGWKRKERSVRNLEPCRSPQVHHKCCEENRENSDGSVRGALFV